MHVAFTEANKNGENDLISTIESSMVIMVRRDPTNPLVVHLVTTIPGANSRFEAFSIRESPEEMARRINLANSTTMRPGIEMPPPEAFGFPKDN